MQHATSNTARRESHTAETRVGACVSSPIEESRAYADIAGAFLDGDADSKVILEVGPGTGRLAQLLKRCAARVVWIDANDRAPDGPAVGSIAASLSRSVAGNRLGRYDAVVTSLSMQNIEDDVFSDCVDFLCAVTDVVFLFENIEQFVPGSEQAGVRSECDLCNAFRQQNFAVCRRWEYSILGKRIVFLKLARHANTA